MDWIPSLISGASSLLGNLFNSHSNSVTNELNRKMQEQVNNQNVNLQKEFAQNSLRWRVDDAKNAGLHPLAAIGANTATYTPSSVAFQADPDHSIGNSMKEIGQNVSNYLLNQQMMKNQAEIANIEAQTKATELKSLMLINRNPLSVGAPPSLTQDKVPVGPGIDNTIATSALAQSTDDPNYFYSVNSDAMSQAMEEMPYLHKLAVNLHRFVTYDGKRAAANASAYAQKVGLIGKDEVFIPEGPGFRRVKIKDLKVEPSKKNVDAQIKYYQNKYDGYND